MEVGKVSSAVQLAAIHIYNENAAVLFVRNICAIGTQIDVTKHKQEKSIKRNIYSASRPRNFVNIVNQLNRNKTALKH